MRHRLVTSLLAATVLALTPVHGASAEAANVAGVCHDFRVDLTWSGSFYEFTSRGLDNECMAARERFLNSSIRTDLPVDLFVFLDAAQADSLCGGDDVEDHAQVTLWYEPFSLVFHDLDFTLDNDNAERLRVTVAKVSGLDGDPTMLGVFGGEMLLTARPGACTKSGGRWTGSWSGEFVFGDPAVGPLVEAVQAFADDPLGSLPG